MAKAESKEKKNGKNLLTNIETEGKSLDAQLENILTKETMAYVMMGAEKAPVFKDFFLCRQIIDAVTAQDIRIIKRLVARIDGNSPKDTELDQYQTKLGDVLNEILEYEDQKQLEIMPTDKPIEAIGKVIAWLALQPSKDLKTPDDKMRKDVASGMIYDRCGGKKTTPLKNELERIYVEPEWLTGGEQDD